MAEKQIIRQRDFSSGQVDASAKRVDDSPMIRAGARQAANWRGLNNGAIKNRPGRRALFFGDGRTDEVRMSTTDIFRFTFGNDGSLTIRDSAGAIITSQPSATYPWDASSVKFIVWDVLLGTVYITFLGMAPATATWDGAAWTFGTYAALVTSAGQKRTAFYRIAAPGIAMLPSATSGAINITFSAPFLTPAHQGARLRFCGRQLTVATYISPTSGTATVNEILPASQALGFASDPRVVFALGDLVRGDTSGAAGIVVATGGAGLTVQLIPSTATSQLVAGFIPAETIVSAGGSLANTTASGPGAPFAVAYWDEEIMGPARAYPRSVFVDQGRLGFTDFPSLPHGIAWSAIGLSTDLYVGPNASDAMFELAPKKCRVFHVVPGLSADEHVFTDIGVYTIPITVQNPLKPGSVIFAGTTPDASSQVKPLRTAEAVYYVTAGFNRIVAIIGVGASGSAKPYDTRDVTEHHTNLFRAGVVTLAATTGDGTFPERYLYALLANGTIALGKYSAARGNNEPTIGWIPWSGQTTTSWVFANHETVLLTELIEGAFVVQRLDDALYLDGAIPINSAPSQLVPATKGPCFIYGGKTVTLMNGMIDLGERQVDVNGFIIQQDGEDLTLAGLVAGKTWTATLEPFIPHVQAGQDAKQALRRRKITRAVVTVQDSNGCNWCGRDIPVYNFNEDQSAQPTLREDSYSARPQGRDYDPRNVLLTKSRPGSLTILELTTEVTI